MLPVRPRVLEVIYQLNDAFAIRRIPLGDLRQELDFVKSSLHKLGRTLLDLKSHVFLGLDVEGKPDGGEVAPAELPLGDVAAGSEAVPGADGVVAALAVAVDALVVVLLLHVHLVVARQRRRQRRHPRHHPPPPPRFLLILRCARLVCQGPGLRGPRRSPAIPPARPPDLG
uniref:Uncharacterized protein n=1 Tax=Arundo donax TaxID=35708 RepID=A0A0A9F754_ARUDO